MISEKGIVLTIGHSNHPLDDFVKLLRKHDITAVADVRSAPYSRHNPQFNRELLGKALKTNGVEYIFLGRELGARSDDYSCYEDGRIQYARLARTDLFCGGIERVISSTRDYRVALMCAEREPLECHRTLLVACALAERGIVIEHILPDGRLEPHEATLERLLDAANQEDLFLSREERLAEALARQENGFPNVKRRLKWRHHEGFTIGVHEKTASRFFRLLTRVWCQTSRGRAVSTIYLSFAGFAKKDDLAWFLQKICGMEYIHVPELAPTQEILDDYKKRRGDWSTYETRFLELMRQRRIEETVPKEVIADGCLLCSEDKPHHCHRRLVAGYLKQHWGDVEIAHLE